MRRTRVIPVLLIHKGGVYKTTQFKRHVYIGDPINAIRLFNDMEVDEIAILDIDASREKCSPDFKMIKELASEAFMPFAYGGGITSVKQAHSLLNCGIEKIIINNYLHSDPHIISKCASEIGSQSVVVSIDVKKQLLGSEKVYVYVSKKTIVQTPVDFAEEAEFMGAGELLINSVDLDGTMSGMDIGLIKSITDKVNIPVIACGGAGTLEHLRAAEQNGASAIAAGSMFVFHGRQRGVLINYPNEKQLQEYLN